MAIGQMDCEVAVVGAGPYGLGAAAHLIGAGIDVRVFGDPLSFWRDHMPKGMFIRSDWNATHFSHPRRQFTLDHYIRQQGFSKPDLLPLTDFLAYGQWFQRNAVPDINGRMVASIHKTDAGFHLGLRGGGSIKAARVVVATGLANQEFKPAPFNALPTPLVSHAADHSDLSQFKGKRVAVVGRGQSACESAAILCDMGADVELLARGPIHWLRRAQGSPPKQNRRPRLRELISAPSGVGPFPIAWLNEFPGGVRWLPQSVRDSVSRISLRPAATGWLKARFDKVRLRVVHRFTEATGGDGRVSIRWDNDGGAYDHVLLGTGYRIDIARLGFFDPDMLSAIAQIDGSPVLGRGFESTVGGLHFLGANAVLSYGPLMRFIAGSPFAARELTRGIIAARRQPKSPRNPYPSVEAQAGAQLAVSGDDGSRT